jgi:hypothetical protein
MSVESGKGNWLAKYLDTGSPCPASIYSESSSHRQCSLVSPYGEEAPFCAGLCLELGFALLDQLSQVHLGIS